MRNPAIYIAAAVLLTATSAHAGFFPGSSASGAGENKLKHSIASMVQTGLLQQLDAWVTRFHADEEAAAGSETTDEAEENKGCKDSAKRHSKKNGKQSAKKDKSGDEETKPSGPEPIYFGF